MITRREYNGILWIDLETPTREEAIQLMNEFELHPVLAEEILTPSLRPKVDRYENCIYLILHFPALRHSHQGNGRQEVDFIISKKFVITVRYESIDPIHKFSKVFEVNSVLDRDEIGTYAGFLFFHMIRKLYASLVHELGYVADQLKLSEERIFAGEEALMVEQLSLIHRDLLNFHQSLRLHREVLESLEVAGGAFYGKSFEPYLRNISGEYHKVNEMLGDLRDTVGELRSTNDSLLTSKTNEVMRNLTIMTFTMLPAGLVAQIFTIPVKNIPFIGHQYDFWIMLGLMFATASSALLYFKHKKWI